MKKKTISFNIMVYNEERCIKRCLDSIINLADEIIVIDTGSTDKTIDIIKTFKSNKIKIFFEKWNNNFSEIRNKMIELSTKNIIFQIDGDEYLDPKQNMDEIKETLFNMDQEIVLSPLIIDFYGAGYSGNLSRIFFNNKKFFYFGMIHEELRSTTSKIIQKNSNIRILHDGYIEKIIKQKNKGARNLLISQKMISLEKDNPRWHYYYIKDLFHYNDDYIIILKEIEKFLNKNFSSENCDFKLLDSYKKEIKIIKEFININIGKGKIKNINIIKNKEDKVDLIFLELLLLKFKLKQMEKKVFHLSKRFVKLNSYSDSIFNDNGDHVLYYLCDFFFLFKDFEKFESAFKSLNINLRKEYYKYNIEILKKLNKNIKKFF